MHVARQGDGWQGLRLTTLLIAALSPQGPKRVRGGQGGAEGGKNLDGGSHVAVADETDAGARLAHLPVAQQSMQSADSALG